MIITGTWDIASIMERNPDYDIDFMIVPGSGKTVPNINVGTYRVINNKTEHPEAAKKFVAFMNSKANQEKLAAGAKAVPSIKGAEISDPVSKKIAAVVTRDDATLYWPHTVSTESLQVKILEGVNKYLAGQELDKTLEEIQKAIDDTRK
jgi:raffinose/stachyose/melibiose transport system substrate-binding protein